MMYFQIKRGNVLIYSVWFSPCKITPLDSNNQKTPTDNSSMAKATEQKNTAILLFSLLSE